ncbi:hypothetical protein F5050DRAFT_1716562 [Lentinula boryana]|uniref:Uncharacterized protein n=1 Tax=Lentinula boryana TaxID=40481 RepID=A0ABQ8PWQ1_9AGAR|nr:hypothetical protein F5050DRAFT_1716562 [Lentinula boryana]
MCRNLGSKEAKSNENEDVLVYQEEEATGILFAQGLECLAQGPYHRRGSAIPKTESAVVIWLHGNIHTDLQFVESGSKTFSYGSLLQDCEFEIAKPHDGYTYWKRNGVGVIVRQTTKHEESGEWEYWAKNESGEDGSEWPELCLVSKERETVDGDLDMEKRWKIRRVEAEAADQHLKKGSITERKDVKGLKEYKAKMGFSDGYGGPVPGPPNQGDKIRAPMRANAYE